MNGWRRRSPKETVRPDINVTPLVDVVLVLLIIFMVVAPRMEQDVQVTLPGIFNPDPEVEGAMDPLKVTVAKAGEYHFKDEKYDLEGVIAALGAEHAADPLRRLVLRADAGLTYVQVREVLARAQQVGFPGLSLMVGERHRPGTPPTLEQSLGDDAPPGQQLPREDAPAGAAEQQAARSVTEPGREDAPTRNVNVESTDAGTRPGRS